MKLRQSNRRKGKKEPDKGAQQEKAPVASVAIWNGERVTIENRELLEEIRQADNPVEKVSSMNIMDFVRAGMDTLRNPFREGPMSSFIAKYRDRLSSNPKNDSPETE